MEFQNFPMTLPLCFRHCTENYFFDISSIAFVWDISSYLRFRLCFYLLFQALHPYRRCVDGFRSRSFRLNLTSLPLSLLHTNWVTGQICIVSYSFISWKKYFHWRYCKKWLILGRKFVPCIKQMNCCCSFGSEHDGENNTCPEDGHVMNATSARNTSHIWQFSSCSVSYMKALLNKLDRYRPIWYNSVS